jgi:hypothetical protein
MLIPRTMLLRLGGAALLDPGRRYWLRRCEGFQVRDLDGHAGTVDHLRFGSRRDVPDALALRVGPFGLRRRLIAVNRIVGVSPEDGSIVVNGCLCGDAAPAPRPRSSTATRPGLRPGRTRPTPAV